MVTARVRPTYVGVEPLPAVESARAAADENRQPGRSRDMIEVNEGFLGFSKGFISGGFLGPSKCYITPTAVIQIVCLSRGMSSKNMNAKASFIPRYNSVPLLIVHSNSLYSCLWQNMPLYPLLLCHMLHY